MEDDVGHLTAAGGQRPPGQSTVGVETHMESGGVAAAIGVVAEGETAKGIGDLAAGGSRSHPQDLMGLQG